MAVHSGEEEARVVVAEDLSGAALTADEPGMSDGDLDRMIALLEELPEELKNADPLTTVDYEQRLVEALAKSVARAAAENVAAVFDTHAVSMAGLYLHGSAALGGFGPSSDLDILVVVEELEDPQLLGKALVELSLGPDLELSVVSAAAARTPTAPWPYLLHVNGKDCRWQCDDGSGDPDLISHYLVTRARGVVVRGAAPAEVIGAVPAAAHRAYLAAELAWAVAHADARYGVLNATRACAWLQTGELLSKVEGAAWWLEQMGETGIVVEALEAQRAGRDLGPCTQRQVDFIEAVRQLLNADDD